MLTREKSMTIIVQAAVCRWKETNA